MSILKNGFTSEITGLVKPIRCKLGSILTDRASKHEGIGVSRQYILKAEIFVEFWASDAEKNVAEDQALRVLNHGIYEDIYKLTSMMRSAAYSDDRDMLFKLIDEIDREISL